MSDLDTKVKQAKEKLDSIEPAMKDLPYFVREVRDYFAEMQNPHPDERMREIIGRTFHSTITEYLRTVGPIIEVAP